MKTWHGIVMIAALGALTWGLVWFLSWRPIHPVTRVPVFTVPGLTMQFAQVGHHEEPRYLLWAICSNRGDLLYLAEGVGGVSAAPALTVIAGGCPRAGSGAAPAPRK